MNEQDAAKAADTIWYWEGAQTPNIFSFSRSTLLLWATDGAYKVLAEIEKEDELARILATDAQQPKG